MKKLLTHTLLAVVLCVTSAPAAKADSPQPIAPTILIAELQTGGSDDATQEFVELFNASDADIDISGWQLQYRSASATAAQSWPSSSTKATVTCPDSTASCAVVLAPKSRIVLAHNLPDDTAALPMTGGLSDKGGQIRLMQPLSSGPIVHDLLGYGTAAHSEGAAPAGAPASGASVKRITSQDGTLLDTNNNAQDFIANCGSPTPGAADTLAIPLASGCHTPVIPDPTPPLQDTTDEFIELYNPNDNVVQLKDYVVQTGADFGYSYTLSDTVLPPQSYQPIYARDSGLSLANSGSAVRLLDSDGAVVYEVPHYGAAKEGQAWIYNDSSWQWTLTPTPGTANTLTLPAPKAVAAASTVAKKKVAAAKVAKPKTNKVSTKIPTPKKTTKKEDTKPLAASAATTANNPPQYWLLLPVGALVAGYAAYEYRHEIGRASRAGWQTITRKKPYDGENPPPA